MARLIVLNGPPGIGKSTLARLYVDEHPLALNLDIDRLRRLLGRWQDDAARAGLLAREMSLILARQHLANGYDVVLPQYLGRTEFLEQAERVARETNAEYYEFILTDNRDEVVRRFNARTKAAADTAHVEAGRLIKDLGGDDTLFAMCDRLLLVISARPNATVIACPEGGLDDAYAAVKERIGA